MRQVHFVVQVELDEDGKPTSALVSDGGPWADSDDAMVWDDEAEEWREATEEESGAADAFVADAFAAANPDPARVEESRLYVLKDDGSLDFYFVGDGDQISAEQAADDYHADNPDVPVVEVTLREVERRPYEFDPADEQEG